MTTHIELTRHAQQRCQQRGISKQTVEFAMNHGTRQHDGHNGVIYTLDRRAVQRALPKIPHGERKTFSNHLNVYIVTDADSGQVITAGHRFRPSARRTTRRRGKPSKAFHFCPTEQAVM